ncbi:MAG: hypothetical protein RL632_1241 [Bacteroidota bacterium]
MKIAMLICMITLSGCLSAQVIFGNSEAAILYYKYENQAQIGTTNGEPFRISSENITIRNEGNGYVLIPQNKERAMLYFNDPKSGKCFDSINFEVRILPPPALFFGSAADGEKVQLSHNKLFVSYNSDIPLIAKFEVQSYEVSTRTGKPIVARGCTIDENVMFYLKSLNKGDTFTIEAKVVGPDGVVRNIKGCYSL